MPKIEELTADDFAPFVGKPIYPIGGPELQLMTLDRRARSGWDGAPRKPFALLLRGPRQPVLPEGLHRMTIDGRLHLTLYVIPVFTAARDHQDYQIVFD